MRLCLALFHEREEERDPAMFGTVDGVLASSQKIYCVLRASIDVMAYLNKMTTRIQSSVLDYAVYYRERKGSYETYSKYITTVTCHNIIYGEAHFYNIGANTFARTGVLDAQALVQALSRVHAPREVSFFLTSWIHARISEQ